MPGIFVGLCHCVGQNRSSNGFTYVLSPLSGGGAEQLQVKLTCQQMTAPRFLECGLLTAREGGGKGVRGARTVMKARRKRNEMGNLHEREGIMKEKAGPENVEEEVKEREKNGKNYREGR